MSDIDSRNISNPISQEALTRLADKLGIAAKHGDESDLKAFFANTAHMSEVERKLFFEMLTERREKGFSDAWQSLWQIDYERMPVPFAEWCEDFYYTGELGKDLFSKWKQELSYITHPANGVLQWLVTGSIGGGKTYAALVALWYKIYVATCLKDPQNYYGIASNTEIGFGIFNTVLANALTVNFNQLVRFIKQSGYFRDHCPARPMARQIDWPTKNITLRIGSSEIHALGTNLLGFLIDEVNFMQKPKEKEELEYQAHKLYHSTVTRLKSRFDQYNDNPGLACIVSSRADQSAFLEKLIEETSGDPQVHVSDYARWETVGRETFSPIEFRVAVGNRYQRSEILDELEIPVVPGLKKPDFYAAKVIRSKPVPDGMDYVAVPANFFHDFHRDIETSLRDIAGVATFGQKPLIYRVESVVECRDETRVHPFKGEWAEVSMDDPESDLIDWVNWDLLTHVQKGSPQPRYFPGEPRFIHCDFALSKDCVAGDTLIATPYGNIPIKQLKDGVPVYCYDEDSGEIVVSDCYDVGLRRKNCEIIEVGTDDGPIRCTFDHEFLLRSGEYRKAKDLQPGDSLMPFYRRETKGKYGGYEEIYCPSTYKYKRAHRIVAEWMKGRELLSEECVHHKNYVTNPLNKQDNRPENLEVMNKKAHGEMHRDIIIAYNKSEAHRVVASQTLKRINANPTPAMQEARKKNGERQIHRLQKMGADVARRPESRKRASDRLKQTHSEGKLRDNWKALHTDRAKENHRISVAKINREKAKDPEFRERLKTACNRSEIRQQRSETAKKLWADGVYDLRCQPITDKMRKCRSKNATLVNHKRWHEDRGRVVDTCPHCRKNHKVEYVMPVEKADTYCMGVHKHHNFVVALDNSRWSSGVVVHNCAGIAMGCAYDKYTITSTDPKTGQIRNTFRPKVWIDFMLQIRPVRGEQIDLEKIVDFILNLPNHGFNLQRVTFDGFQSAMAIQKVMKANLIPDRKRQAYRSGRFNDKLEIETNRLSLDRDASQYRMLRDALNFRAISYYHYPIFEDEVLALIDDPDAKSGKGHVDHQPSGSKDVSDAVCGVNFNIATSKQGYPADPVDGILEDRSPNVEDTMVKGVIEDYVQGPRIAAIIPAPKKEPRPRKLKTSRQDWMRELKNFGTRKRI